MPGRRTLPATSTVTEPAGGDGDAAGAGTRPTGSAAAGRRARPARRRARATTAPRPSVGRRGPPTSRSRPAPRRPGPPPGASWAGPRATRPRSVSGSASAGRARAARRMPARPRHHGRRRPPIVGVRRGPSATTRRQRRGHPGVRERHRVVGASGSSSGPPREGPRGRSASSALSSARRRETASWCSGLGRRVRMAENRRQRSRTATAPSRRLWRTPIPRSVGRSNCSVRSAGDRSGQGRGDTQTASMPGPTCAPSTAPSSPHHTSRPSRLSASRVAQVARPAGRRGRGWPGGRRTRPPSASPAASTASSSSRLSARAAVRTFSSVATLPSSICSSGFTASAPPNRAAAAPIRPPRRRYSSVST